VLMVSLADVWVPTLTTWWPAHQEVQDPVAEGGVQSQGPELGGHYGVEH
jgi:hypothetical protein